MKYLQLLLALLIFLLNSSFYNTGISSADILSYEINPKQQELKFYWKNKHGQPYHNFAALKSSLEKENKTLLFAMNGGMYMQNSEPLGLYIENHITKKQINHAQNSYGNFYLQPNGVFYITNKKEAVVCTSKNFKHSKEIKYATQSGPMLLIDGKMHPKFIKNSTNLNIRNGVGILPNGNVLFAMSKTKINFYDFANYFKEKGCENALYLDGFVSRTYLPSKDWEQIDGEFGVIIGLSK